MPKRTPLSGPLQAEPIGNSLPLVSALEHLIDAVGTSEPHLFASLTESEI